MLGFLPYAALMALMNSPESNGQYGEMIVKSVFQLKSFQKVEHYVLNDVYFEVEGTGSTQVDHIYISSKGIFVIETKHISGTVIAYPDNDYWLLDYGKARYKLYSPIKQNKLHVDVVSNLFENKYKVHSVVVFTKNNKPNPELEGVINFAELKKYLLNFDGDDILSSEDMKMISDTLTKYQKEHKITKSKHIANINKNSETKNKKGE